MSSAESGDSTGINLKSVFAEALTEDERFFGGGKEGNVTVDPSFGQRWHLGGLTEAEVYSLGTYFGLALQGRLPEPKDQQHITEELENLYTALVRLNPELKNIRAENIRSKEHIICGIGSGLHFNDIKYYVEDLKGEGGAALSDEERGENGLIRRAQKAYHQRHGVDVPDRLRDEDGHFEFSPEEKARHDIKAKVAFIFSPETAQRIIENRPYQTEKQDM